MIPIPLLVFHVAWAFGNAKKLKLKLHDAICRLRFYSNSLIHILSLSNTHNNVASIRKNRGDKSYRIIVALVNLITKQNNRVIQIYENFTLR